MNVIGKIVVSRKTVYVGFLPRKLGVEVSARRIKGRLRYRAFEDYKIVVPRRGLGYAVR